MCKTFGYCRISTAKQSIDRQVRNILASYPDADIRKEVFTGTHYKGRDELQKILNRIHSGDTIVFDSVSRMSRNADEGIKLYFDLFNRGVNLVFLKENYITRAEHDKKLTKAETDRDTWKEKATTAEEALKGFEGVDKEAYEKTIAELQKKADEAESKATAQILARDQRDYLKAEFDKLGITSERTRKSLAADIMGDDGLKWKDGAFLGLSDYLAQENAKDHFYKTEEEKKQGEAEEKKPKFTSPKQTIKDEPAEQKPIPKIW